MRLAPPVRRIVLQQQQQYEPQYTPALLPLLRRRAWCSITATTTSSALCTSHRCLSQQGHHWLNKLRYGADDAPTMGSWDSAYEDDAMDTRKLYCKALVHASGGSRLARDWIAGCAALTSPDPSLVYTALQHSATETDVRELRDHILGRLLAQESSKRSGHNGGSSDKEVQTKLDVNQEAQRDVVAPGTGDGIVEIASAPNDAGRCGIYEGDNATEVASPPLTADAILDAEHYLLRRAPEVCCFMYDTMSASLFHSNNDSRTIETARRHTFSIGSTFFGFSVEDLTVLWRVVEAEMLLKKEKIKVLGQPWGE
ncbi:hypothetical protein JKF63_06675 [Porcisia hertigi]|uniref:Uncharacterized protein n=1 Tax=Porcisia hertigi TaxID=2761500 RepID=A0A836IYP5_9TRYP|nr:hypothetical protein JKF63_06675 [Porcisia hertigi]